MGKNHAILRKLEEYLNGTTEEQLKNDWEELKQYNQSGPEMLDCLNMPNGISCDNIYLENLRLKKRIAEIEKEIDKKCELWCEEHYPLGESTFYGGRWTHSLNNPDYVSINIIKCFGEESEDLWVDVPINEL